MKTPPIALIANHRELKSADVVVQICADKESAIFFANRIMDRRDYYHPRTRKPTGKEFDMYLSAGNKVFKR